MKSMGQLAFEVYVQALHESGITLDYRFEDLSTEAQRAYESFAKKSGLFMAVSEFQSAAGDTVGIFNTRQFARYTGMQCEELCEKLTAAASGEGGYPPHPDLLATIAALENIGDRFKQGEFDHHFDGMTTAQRKEAFDADIDVAWVSYGSINSAGVDAPGGFGQVGGSNMSKIVDGRVLRDKNGKIRKDVPSYFAPDLARFVLPK